MSTFTITLDKRVQLKDGRYNLTVRVVDGKQVQYLNLEKLTQDQYNMVFVDKSLDPECQEFRKKCNGYISKCERIYSQMGVYDRKEFKRLFFLKDDEQPSPTHNLSVVEMFERYAAVNDLKLKTKQHYRMVGRILNTFQPGLKITEITPDFLKKFESFKRDAGCSLATVNSYNRDLRSLIRYYTFEDKIIPQSYSYPYGRGRYVIGSYFPKKLVPGRDEIQKVLEFKDIDNKDLEYARDIWALLYNLNGMNIGDLLWMKKSDTKGKYILYQRRKTLTTRKNNITPITVPVTPDIENLIKRVENKDSEYLLGLVQDDYDEQRYENKLRKIRKKLNGNLTIISERLNLSVPLKLETARDCYASTLLREGISKDDISVMLGHSNSVVTEHYLSGIDLEKTFGINSVLVKKPAAGSEKKFTGGIKRKNLRKNARFHARHKDKQG